MDVDCRRLIGLIAIFHIRNIDEVLVVLSTVRSFNIIRPACALNEGIPFSCLVFKNIEKFDCLIEGRRIYNELGGSVKPYLRLAFKSLYATYATSMWPVHHQPRTLGAKRLATRKQVSTAILAIAFKLSL